MIYLDHNATTPVLSGVREAILPYLAGEWGNPSSLYRFGSNLRPAIERAREQVAGLIGAESARDIFFTSGGTESNNAAIHSALLAAPNKKHIITSEVEHASVLSYCRYLEGHHGYRVSYLPVDQEGLLSITALEDALTDDTAIVSLMWANNETGVLSPVAEIAELCDSRGIPYHCDAVQAAGKLVIDVQATPIDYLSITGHKFGAPKGIGALYVKVDAPFIPFTHGGHQEGGRRGGTENVPFIIGLGVAADHATKNLAGYDYTVRPLRDALEQAILGTIPRAEVNGANMQRLANTTNVFLPGVDNDAALTYLDQFAICASSGSACMESAISPSHVIMAMTGSHDRAGESIRFSLSTTNVSTDVATTIERLKEFVELSA